MADQKPRGLAERLFETLGEEELSRPVRLECVDQVFHHRTLLRPEDRDPPERTIMADEKPRSLAERFAEGLSEDELSRPIHLEGVDAVFTLRTLCPSLAPRSVSCGCEDASPRGGMQSRFVPQPAEGACAS